MPAAIAAAYAAHMLATVVWIGGLVFLGFFAAPLLARLPEDESQSARAAYDRRFAPVAWLCLAVFVVTGLMQMSASPRYAGLLVVRDPWSGAILVKHILVALMAALLAYQTWVLYPRLERMELGLDPQASARLAHGRRLDLQLVRLSALLGVAVLLLTAIARASN
jgi:putative copper export protein